MARYTIIITPDHPGEPSAKVAVEYTGRRGARVLEWSVVAGRNGYAAPPVLEAIIAAIDADGSGVGKPQLGRPSATAELGLSTAATSALWKAGITRIPQLTALTEEQLRRTSGVRRAYAGEIVAALNRFGLVLTEAAAAAEDDADAPAVPRQRGKAGRRKTRSRPYRLAPENLPQLYSQFRGSPSAIAQAQGVPRQTVNNWIRTARNNGRLPLLTPRPDGS